MREALARGADALLVVGVFGGPRVEHSLANVLLLCMPELHARDVRLADASSVVRLVEAGAPLELDGRRGDFLSLMPLTPEVHGVTTDGLAFALTDETLTQGPARGLSNVMSGERALISVADGRLLAIHTRWAEMRAPSPGRTVGSSHCWPRAASPARHAGGLPVISASPSRRRRVRRARPVASSPAGGEVTLLTHDSFAISATR